MSQTDRNGVTNSPEAPPGVFRWRGVWVTGTAYNTYDAFFNAGSSYIVNVSHTAGVFATDLAAGNFELMASQGTSGSGTGDMLAANNLSEVAPTAARGNLLAQLRDSEGAPVAAASSTNIWATDGTCRHVTGNTPIDDFGTAPYVGATMLVKFDGTPLLKQGTNNNLNAGGNDIQIEADDWAVVSADTTTQHDVVVHRKSGLPVSNSVVGEVKSFTAVHDTPSNGFTITLPAGSLQFRSTTLTDGTPVTRTNAAPTTLVVSSGSTLGTANNLLAVLEVRAVDTGSGFVPAVVNIFGAPRNDETDLITTVAEGGAGAADNYAVVYAAAVHSSKPYRVLGYIYSNQPSAGTWTTAFTLVQGASPQFRINSTFSAIRVYTDAGFGSTNTAIRRFSTVDYNFGTAITYTSSATLGDSFTINESGLYAISFTDNFTTTANMGISQNSSQLTTTILSIATSDIIASTTAHTTGYQGCVAATLYLDAGDVIRAHCGLSLAAGANNGECFTITKLL